ncbi:MAG: hypothetical protein NWF06_00730 [Candidatus Bathyarchaeota archaeon]|nr:hypothetical protein [Candidatus Bathyarchaeum sp.]
MTEQTECILDATAGNQVFYKTKESEKVVYLDLETKLERKPTIFADNRKLPFQDCVFHTILFDPPHAWAFYSIFYGFPDAKTFRENHPNDGRAYPTYYGMDKYKTKSALISAIFQAQKEFHRVLTDNGMLWLNWSDLKVPLKRILPLFSDWNELIRLRVASNNQQMSDCYNWWVAFVKDKKTVSLEHFFLRG